MNVVIEKDGREQKAIRLNRKERSDLHTVAKSVLNATESEAVALVFTRIAEEYKKDKDSKELIIKIKMGQPK